MKRCSACKIKKPFDCFNKDKAQKDGFNNQCKECQSIRGKKYYQENKEKVSKWMRQYRKDNPDKIKERNQRRRALKLDQLGYIPDNYLDLLKERDYPDCKYCGTDIIDNYHIDHIYPISKGGLHDITNLQLICPTCNMSKGNKSEEEFVKFIEIATFCA